MNRTKWFLACAALALLCAWPAVGAEKGDGAPVVTGQNTGRSIPVNDGATWKTLTGTSGGLNIANPPQGWIYRWPTVIQAAKRPNSAAAGGGSAATPDTSGVYPATGATRWIMFIYPTFDDSTASVLMAFSARAHPIESADSLSTYTLLARRVTPVNVTALGATARDTIGSLSDTTGFDYCDSLAMPDERIIVLHHGPQPRGRGIEFSYTGDWISLRVRILNVVTEVIATGRAFCGRDPLTTYKIDLYGYRE